MPTMDNEPSAPPLDPKVRRAHASVAGSELCECMRDLWFAMLRPETEVQGLGSIAMGLERAAYRLRHGRGMPAPKGGDDRPKASDSAQPAMVPLSMDTAPQDGTELLLLTKSHGWMEAYFDSGKALTPEHADGLPVWILGDDLIQFAPESPDLLGWLPRDTLPPSPKEPLQ